MNSSVILEPTAAGSNAAHAAWQPLETLKGKVVGFIDNSKPNFNHLVDDIAHLLITRHGVKSVVKLNKSANASPAPEEIIQDVAASCDVVITGSGD